MALRTRSLQLLLLLQGMGYCFIFSTIALLPELVDVVYDAKVGPSVGILQAAYGLGGLLGALALSQLSRGRPQVKRVLALGGVEGVLLVVLSLTTSVPLGAAVLLPLGVAQAMYLTTLSTLFAIGAADAERGRAMSLNLVASALQPLALVPLTQIGGREGPALAIAVAGIGFCLGSLAFSIAIQRRGRSRRISPTGVAP